MELHHKILRRADWYPDHTSGWGNGYVGVPKEHPLYGVDYSDVPWAKMDVHEGLTYSRKADSRIKFRDKSLWVFGFDTAHYGDTLKTWPRKRVLEETLRMKELLENYPQTLTIIRGLPGLGKSTKAKKLTEFTNSSWFESDMFFTKPDDVYLWSAKHLNKAHE